MSSTAIPGLGSRDEAPRPNLSANPTTTGLSSQEGWVLSRVDGRTTLGDLCLITGLGENRTVEILRALVARGLVLVDGVEAEAPPASPVAGPTVAGRVRMVSSPTQAAAVGAREAASSDSALARDKEQAARWLEELYQSALEVLRATPAQRQDRKAQMLAALERLRAAMRGFEETLETLDADGAAGGAETPIAIQPVTKSEPVSAADDDLEALVKTYADGIEQSPASASSASVERSGAHGNSGPLIPPPQAPRELTADLQRQILHKHERLAHDDQFELLELSLDADRRDVKRAYFRLSKQFHPDRYFGKELGPFRARLGDIFRALTQAAEFLSDDARRADYVRMIQQQHELRDLQSSLERATAAALEEDRRLTENVESGPQAVPTPASGRIPTASPNRAERSPTRRLLRQALARQLSDERTSNAQRHYEEGLRQLKHSQWISAVASLKLAVTFAPDNAEYTGALREAEERAADLQAAMQGKRAELEERAGRFDAAARCYEASAKLRPSFQNFYKAGEMYLKIRELKLAKENGIKAKELEPANASGHMLLAQIFREAKQFKDAKAELERVIELNPQDKSAKTLLKEIQKLA